MWCGAWPYVWGVDAVTVARLVAPEARSCGARSMEIVIPGAANLGLFTAAALALLLVPGPAVLYIVARSVEPGRVAGFVSDLGIHSATLVHVAAASTGLSALLRSSALPFEIVKSLGAAYLLWLGLRRLLTPAALGGGQALSRPGPRLPVRGATRVNLTT